MWLESFNGQKIFFTFELAEVCFPPTSTYNGSAW